MRGSERVRVWEGNTGRRRSREHGKDPRVWNRDEYRRLESESFSIFVDNLPENISKRELFQLFNWTGRINDIYISRKYKNGDIYMFAFIRYTTKGGALKAIAEMNRIKLRGKVLFVGEAKYRRMSGKPEEGTERGGDNKQNPSTKQLQRDVGDNNFLNGRELRSEQDRKIHRGNAETKKLEATVVEENIEWLQRSLVGVTTKPLDFNSLKETTEKILPSVVQIREMGAYKALLTFDSVLNANETYTFKLNCLLQIFHKVWRWRESERSDTRRVWLECFGVPLHAWSVDTFNMIGSQWGAVVGCAKETELCSSFTVGRVLVHTCVMEVIRERVHISVGSGGYDVLVKEAGHGVCDRECRGSCFESGIRNCVVLDHDIAGTSTERNNCQTRQSIPSNKGQHDEGSLMVVTRGEERDKGRIVICADILNDWVRCGTIQNREKGERNQILNGVNHGPADFGDKKSNSHDEDSDRTLTCDYDFLCNGLKRGSTKEEKKQKNEGCTKLGGRNKREALEARGKKTHMEVGSRGLGPTLFAAGLDPGRMESAQQHSIAFPCAQQGSFGEGVLLLEGVGDTCVGDGKDGSRRSSDLGSWSVCGEDDRVRSGGEDHDGVVGSTGIADGTANPSVTIGLEEEHDDAKTMGMGAGYRRDGHGAAEKAYLNMVVCHSSECGSDAGIGEEEGNNPDLGAPTAGFLYHSGGKVAEHDAEDVTGAETGQSNVAIDEEDTNVQCLQEQMLENHKTWELALESGAMLVNEEDDIMAILQAQNEEIAQRKMVAKQKAKMRRCRPKNKKQSLQ